MTTYEFIKKELTKEQFTALVKLGVISCMTAFHMEVYEWHITHGRSQRLTSQHFGISPASVGFAMRKMETHKL